MNFLTVFLHDSGGGVRISTAAAENIYRDIFGVITPDAEGQYPAGCLCRNLDRVGGVVSQPQIQRTL